MQHPARCLPYDSQHLVCNHKENNYSSAAAFHSSVSSAAVSASSWNPQWPWRYAEPQALLQLLCAFCCVCACLLQWNEGDVWTGQVELELDSPVAFKYIQVGQRWYTTCDWAGASLHSALQRHMLCVVCA